MTAALSYWHDSLPPDDDLRPRSPLPGDLDADVAIVGAGYSGLWTAYYLRRADPSIRVVVLERDTAGFGASGRNGGWCVGDQGAPLPALERSHGKASVVAMVRMVQAAVDEVGTVCEREAIDCGFTKAGALYAATSEAQLRRLRGRQIDYDRYGLGDSFEELGPREATAIANARGLHGGLFTPHAAAVHPARLVRGLAVAAERLGVVVHEQTRVDAIEPRRVRTARGTVKAEVVVRATEAYTNTLEGGDRTMLAIGNYMIATEPLDGDVWAEIGLARRELFEDTTMMLGYGQRTSDGRFAIGGLGAPYWWGSRVPPSPMTNRRNADRLRALLVARFPVLRDAKVTHHWGGVLGIPRDFRPSVRLDRATGMAWLGGYGGSGVASSNLAGRSLADVITATDSDAARLPWVGHSSPPWEPEPLRWLGVNAVKLRARLHDLRERA